MAGFHEVRFPTGISYRSAGGPGFSTAVIETDSGAEERVARWSTARRRYNAAYGLKNHTDLTDLIKFYIARQGPAYGFRFKDYLDCTTSSSGLATELGGDSPDDEDVVIGTGDGNNKTFQLVKKYTSGPTTRTRNIIKPVSGTTVIAIDGAGQGAGWSVDTTTGIVTFTVAPDVDKDVTAGCEFDTPVRFGTEVDEVLELSIEAFGYGSSQDIPLIEVKDEGEVNDEFFFGGAAEIAMSADTSITIQTGRVLYVTSVSAGLKLILPDETNLATGGPYFYIYNAGGSHSFSLRDDDDAEVKSIGIGEYAIVLLALNGAVKEWWAIS